MDIKERELSNADTYRSSSLGSSNSSSGDSDRRPNMASARTAEREPGELSIGSGSDGDSDGDVASEMKVNDIKVSKVENRVKSTPSKRRKLSPIVWDSDEKEANNSSKMRLITRSSHLPAPPLPLKSFHQPPHVISDGDLQISPAKDDQRESSQPSAAKPFDECNSAPKRQCPFYDYCNRQIYFKQKQPSFRTRSPPPTLELLPLMPPWTQLHLHLL